MLKSTALRDDGGIGVDLRTQVWSRLEALPASQLAVYYYPRLFAVHNNSSSGDSTNLRLPIPLCLSRSSLAPDGVYLLDNGESISLWVGRSVDACMLEVLFGAPTLESLEGAGDAEAMIRVGEASGSWQNSTISWVIEQVRADHPVPFLPLRAIVRQGMPAESVFLEALVEDGMFLGELGLTVEHAESPPFIFPLPPTSHSPAPLPSSRPLLHPFASQHVMNSDG